MSKYEMDMTEGHIGKKLLIFSIPLILSTILQLAYNAFDIIVLGKLVNYESMAAVTSTGPLVALFTNFFLGLSVGCSVIMARYYGAKDNTNASKTLHTTIWASIIIGIVVTILGVSLSKGMLILSNTPDILLGLSTTYLQIYFAGILFNIVYNFGSAILRAVGDTKRPLIYLAIAGVLNIGFNLLFVLVFDMGVAGVALGTIISEFVSALLVVITLCKSNGVLHLAFKELKMDKKILKDMIVIGLPAGIQSTVFNVSNVIIQSKINSFGEIAIAGNGAAGNLEGFIYASISSVYQGVISFTSQNYAVGKMKNIKKTLYFSYLYATLFSLLLGGICLVFSKQLLFLYNENTEVISIGRERLLWLGLVYPLCGFMDCTSGLLRGIGKSNLSMLMTIVGVVGFRITWVYSFFNLNPTLTNLYISYPISWTITWLCELAVFIYLYKKLSNNKKLNIGE